LYGGIFERLKSREAGAGFVADNFTRILVTVFYISVMVLLRENIIVELTLVKEKFKAKSIEGNK
jgi:hypothetical protein